MTADLTPARCGDTAVHPPHPIDGSAPGVADCDGLKRDATATETAQAHALVDELASDWTGPMLERRRERLYERILAVLVHANGGRYTEPTPDSERWILDYLRRTAAHDSPRWDVAARDIAAHLAAPDRLVTAVLDAATVLAEDLRAAPRLALSANERALARAVEAMLDARSSDGTGLLNRSESPLPAERAEVVPESTLEGPGCSARPLGTIPLPTTSGTGSQVDDLPEWERKLLLGEPPVTPAADLADEAAHERVARALLDADYPDADIANGIWADPIERASLYKLARAAIDAYRAGPGRNADEGAVNYLLEQLDSRGITNPSEEITARAIVRATLDHIDRLTTALDEAARDAHEAAELEAAYDDGLSTNQEIRARALDAAVRMTAPPDTQETTIAVARVLEAFIRDGADDPWEATNGQRRYSEGYAEAVRRLTDTAAYDTWRTTITNPSAHPDTTTRRHLAGYLWHHAPNPDDPWADAAPTTRPVLDGLNVPDTTPTDGEQE